MSKISKIAEKIVERLGSARTETELSTPIDISGIPVIFDRQTDIRSKVDRKMEEASGAVLTLLYQGWRIEDENASRPRVMQIYTLELHARYILLQDDINGGAKWADDVIESVILRLWHWRPELDHVYGECKPGDGDMLPDQRRLSYSCNVEVPTFL